MSNNSRSSDDSPRDAAKLSGDERAGHSLIGDRTAKDRPSRESSEPAKRTERKDEDATDGVTRTPRQPESGSDSNAPRSQRPTPASEVPGNTSETNRSGNTNADAEPGTEIAPPIGKPTGTGSGRSPLGPGCAKTSGTMFIAAVSMLGIALRFKR